MKNQNAPLNMEDVFAGRRQNNGETILSAKDIPAKVREFSVLVLKTREAPKSFTTPILLDTDTVFGRDCVPMNITNVRIACDMMNSQDLSGLNGKTLTFRMIPQTNPKNGEVGRGLMLIEMKGGKSASKPTAKKSPAKKSPARKRKSADDGEI